MFLSSQTYEGLKISSYSHMEIIPFLLGEGFEYVFTERFMQDVVEDYFGHQRGIHVQYLCKMSNGPVNVHWSFLFVRWTNGHLNVHWTFLFAQWTNGHLKVEWTFLFVHWSNGHMNVQWTFLFVQWSNGHWCMSNGHY